MYSIDPAALKAAIKDNVTTALAEDIADGDINAALINARSTATASVLSRQTAVVCGTDWVDEVFRQIDPAVQVNWQVRDGDRVNPDDVLLTLNGKARALLSGERVALNFLQLLSAIATKTAYFVEKVTDTGVTLLDTRKTLPGLRLAQKYAVTCGGAQSHRMGLYDAFLIKENHIAASGGIHQAVALARALDSEKIVEVETETLAEFQEAVDAGADVIMLDNFSLEDTRTAVELGAGQVKIEASGGVNEKTLVDIAHTGVDFISMGTLTKDIAAIDLSMRLVTSNTG
ncbi:MAG: carboxylating nicotinate-nucleotide diphosphorylase [Saccharospirillum sp.]|uniref:carboxylating nicotinate-nucleotide diphosphorylase n=1 Tax=Saccharospirillum sp. TaxID=2033801 RepID=UPI003296AD95